MLHIKEQSIKLTIPKVVNVDNLEDAILITKSVNSSHYSYVGHVVDIISANLSEAENKYYYDIEVEIELCNKWLSTEISAIRLIRRSQRTLYFDDIIPTAKLNIIYVEVLQKAKGE